MAKQLRLPFIDNNKKDTQVFEIYKLDSAVYPYIRRYHSHIKFVIAPCADDASNQERRLFEAARKDNAYLGIKEASREDVMTRSIVLEGQLEACYDAMKKLDS
tara:strand:- start:7668 stop:7976 length:309 start_codon:yes stop_codon:yes gene_type:complete